jgi:hypothetical protein
MEERAMIERHLAQAEGHVALGESHIARQIQIVTELERDGHEQTAIIARQLLATFERPKKLTLEIATVSALNWPRSAEGATREANRPIENPAGAGLFFRSSFDSCDSGVNFCTAPLGYPHRLFATDA